MKSRRLPPFDKEREFEELRVYLGDRYDHTRLVRWQEEVDEEYERVGDEAAFYRSSEAYLYNLTVFAISETKLPYLETVAKLVAPEARLLDFGCGIGSDGLYLIEAGYRVAFADFDNPSTNYLRWRLERRGFSGEIYDLDRNRLPRDFDLVFAFDVIEHVDDPFDFLAEMESHARLVAVNFLQDEPGKAEMHRRLPIAELLRYVSRRRVLSYRRHHTGSSHMVVYEPGRVGLRGRLLSTTRVLAGRLLRPRP